MFVLLRNYQFFPTGCISLLLPQEISKANSCVCQHYRYVATSLVNIEFAQTRPARITCWDTTKAKTEEP